MHWSTIVKKWVTNDGNNNNNKNNNKATVVATTTTTPTRFDEIPLLEQRQ
jgi:hypothetical protein